jgi:hypothetical protein
MLEAMKKNLFDSTHFAWIDINLLSKKFYGKFISQNNQDKIIEIILNDLDAPKVISFLKEVKPLSDSQNNVSIDLLLEAVLGLKLEDVA